MSNLNYYLTRSVLAFGLISLLAGCGGGSTSTNVTPVVNASVSLKNETAVLDGPSLQTAAVGSNTNGQTTLTLDSTASLTVNGNAVNSASIAVGTVIFIPSGDDSRFPLGLTGKVASVTTNAGTTEFVLDQATLADVASQSSSSATQSIPLDASNFIGVIAPNAVHAASSALQARLRAQQTGVTALNGGIVVQRPRVLKQSTSFLGASGSISAGTITLNLEVDLSQMVDDPTTIKPYGSAGTAKFIISGSLNNLALEENHDFSLISGLKSLNLKVTGNLSAEAKLQGGFQTTLGYFSQAWKEVESESFSLLGMTAKLTGLDSKAKVGKYPVAGLVFSLPCSVTSGGCPVTAGSTQTPLREAKAGGVIVWLYLNANGTLTLDGDTGVRVNAGQLTLGIDKPDGGSLGSLATLNPSSSDPLLQAPFFQGTLDFVEQAGVSLDVDFFVAGVHIANASMFAGEKGSFNATATDEISYQAQDLNSPWQLSDGSLCYSMQLGGGLIVSADLDAGVNLNSAGIDVAYSIQIPTDTEIAQVGRHGTWFTGAVTSACGIQGGGNPTCNLSLSPSTVVSGQSSLLLATFAPSDAVFTIDNGIGAMTSGASTLVTPTSTTTYTGTVTNQAGTSTCQTTLTVSGAPPVDTNPPSVPTNLSATASYPNQIDLSWSASTDDVGVAGYDIYRDGTFLINETGLSYSDTGLAPSAQHCYTIDAYDAAGNKSALSTEQCVTTPVNVAPIATTMTAAYDPPRIGRMIHYTIMVTNRTAATQYYMIQAPVPNNTIVPWVNIAQGGLATTCDGATSVTCHPGGVIQWGNASGYPIQLAAGQSISVSYAAMLDPGSTPVDGTVIAATATAIGVNPTTSSASAGADVTVSTSGLSLGETADHTVAAPGASITYTFSYANPGSSGEAVDLVAPIPAGTTFSSATGGGTLSTTDHAMHWALGTLDPGASGSVRLVVTADPNAIDGYIVNSMSRLVDSATGTVVARADVAMPLQVHAATSLTVTGPPALVGIGQPVKYSVTVSNPTTVNQYYVIDAIVPNGIHVPWANIDQGATSTTCGGATNVTCPQGTVIQWGNNTGYPVSVAAGQSITFAFTGIVDSVNPLSPGSIVRATATATGVLQAGFGAAVAADTAVGP